MAVRTRAEVRKTRRILPADKPRRAGDIGGITLDGRKLDMAIGDRLLDAILERTIDGPDIVTLSLWNHDQAVLRSGVLGGRAMSHAAQIRIDRLAYVAAGVSKQGDVLEVSFEDATVVRLKRHGRGKPVKAVRSKNLTAARFCANLIRQAGVPVLVLDENVVQPIAGKPRLKEKARKAKGENTPSREKDRASKRGVPGDLTIKGVRATSEQRRVMATALERAQAKKAGDRATVALLVAVIQESTAKNLTGGHSTSTGALQLLSTTAASLRVNPRDVAAVCDLFLDRGFWKYAPKGAIQLARENPSWTPGAIAQACQGSAGSGSDYDRWRSEAEQWLAAAGSGSLAGAAGKAKPYKFERLKTESTWAACWRILVDERGWRLFCREGVIVIASDPALMRARPALEIDERSDVVEGLDFDWHRALKVGEMRARAYVGRWNADPGEVVTVKDLPQSSGRWLLARARASLLSPRPLMDLELRAPAKPRPEPANEVAAGGQSNAGGAVADDGAVAAAYRKAVEIHNKRYPYVYGGGHGSFDGPYDCSGFVSAVLHAAGLVSAPMSTSGFISWGQSGRGKQMTVWVKEIPGSPTTSHMFMTFDIGNGQEIFEAGGGGGPTGRRTSRSFSGFVPRHAPGT